MAAFQKPQMPGGQRVIRARPAWTEHGMWSLFSRNPLQLVRREGGLAEATPMLIARFSSIQPLVETLMPSVSLEPGINLEGDWMRAPEIIATNFEILTEYGVHCALRVIETDSSSLVRAHAAMHTMAELYTGGFDLTSALEYATRFVINQEIFEVDEEMRDMRRREGKRVEYSDKTKAMLSNQNAFDRALHLSMASLPLDYFGERILPGGRVWIALANNMMGEGEFTKLITRQQASLCK